MNIRESNKDIKILVVDDQEGIRQLLYEVLQSEGYVVEVAESGSDALKAVEEFNPDILIIDMKMPGMSGLDVLKLLDERNCDVKPIIMTAYGELEIINEASQLGVKHYINKPFDIEDLLEIIKEVSE